MKTKLNLLVILTLLVVLLGANVGAVSALTPVGDLNIYPETLEAAVYQTTYSQQLTAEGGTGPYSFSLYEGTLPSGITLSPDGLLSGYATGSSAIPGSYPITIWVDDSTTPITKMGTRQYNFVLDKVTPVVELNSQTPIYWGNTFNISAWVKIYDSPSSFRTLAGTVAFTIDGLTVPGCDAVPYDMGYYPCSVTMDLDPGDHSFVAYYTPEPSSEALYNSVLSESSSFTINPTIRSIGGVIFRDDDKDGDYNVNVEYSIGSGWTVNLDKECNGTIDYTTTSSSYFGSYNFVDVPAPYCYRISVNAEPGYQQTTVLEDFTLTETDLSKHIGFYYPTIILSPDSLPSGSVGTEYSQTFSASGGSEPYTFTYWGILPDGMTLSEAGVLSGTPTVGGDYIITVQAQDVNQVTGYHHYTLLIPADGNFTFTSSTNPSTPGAPVTFTVSANGTAYASNIERQVPPIGAVTFNADGVPIEGCSELYLNFAYDENGNENIGNYPATCTTSALAAGSHQITVDFYSYVSVFITPLLNLTQTVQTLTAADLSISVTDSKDPVKRGTTLVYTLTVRNAGLDAAQSVIVVDTLDPDTAFVSAKAPKGWTCTYASPEVTCTGASLTSGRSAVIKITVRVNKATAVGKNLINTASVTSETVDPDMANNSASQTTRVVK